MFRRTVLSHLGATPLEAWKVPGLDVYTTPTPRWEAYCVGAVIGRSALVLSQGLLACLGQEELAELAVSATKLSGSRRQAWLTVLAAVSLWLRFLMPKQMADALMEGQPLARSISFGALLRALLIWPYLALLNSIRKSALPKKSSGLALEMESLRIERNLGAHHCEDLRALSLLQMNSGEMK